MGELGEGGEFRHYLQSTVRNAWDVRPTGRGTYWEGDPQSERRRRVGPVGDESVGGIPSCGGAIQVGPRGSCGGELGKHCV